MNKTTATVFFGIILAGLVVSLTVLNKCERPARDDRASSVSEAEPASETKGANEPEAASGKPPGKAKTPPPADTAATDPAEKKPEDAPAEEPRFRTPGEALAALADKVGERDFGSVEEVTGPEAISESARPAIRSLIESPDFSLDPGKPHTEVSKSANSGRWSLNFVPDTGGAARQLYVDLELDEEENYQIKGLSLPLEIAEVTRPRADAPPENGSPDAPAPPSLVGGADALTIAHAFSKAVIGRNFQVARGLSDPATVTDERVAALMIAIEEGGFHLKEERPLVVTLSREDITWVLARIEAEELSSEFAVELGQVEDAWKVNGLTFSKVLSALSSQAGAGDVAYSPIVEDPMGGDSLVLYFEFDEAGINERGKRQLSIIADILSQGAERVIRINGHADALGTGDYNEVLSNRRAQAIREGLISMGVSPDQVVTEAFGDTRPRRPNFNPDGTDNPSGRSQNRRAEVYLDF